MDRRKQLLHTHGSACMTRQINPTPLECGVNGTECYDGWVWAILCTISRNGLCNITSLSATSNYSHQHITCKRDHNVANSYIHNGNDRHKNSAANGYNEPIWNKHFHGLWQVQGEIWYLSIEIITNLCFFTGYKVQCGWWYPCFSLLSL